MIGVVNSWVFSRSSYKLILRGQKLPWKFISGFYFPNKWLRVKIATITTNVWFDQQHEGITTETCGSTSTTIPCHGCRYTNHRKWCCELYPIIFRFCSCKTWNYYEFTYPSPAEPYFGSEFDEVVLKAHLVRFSPLQTRLSKWPKMKRYGDHSLNVRGKILFWLTNPCNFPFLTVISDSKYLNSQIFGWGNGPAMSSHVRVHLYPILDP